MTHPNPPGTPAQPSLSDLMARYLQRQVAAQATGLACPETGEVVPFEAAPVQPVDPRLAWDEALTALEFFRAGKESGSWQPPPEWSALVAGHEPVMALPFCVGNFPQLVRNFHPLLNTTDLATLRPGPGQPASAEGLLDWATSTARKKDVPQTLRDGMSSPS